MTRENMLPSVKMYQLVQKLLKVNECNAFTANCSDACSTCRINKERFTFCISHSLNNENGVMTQHSVGNRKMKGFEETDARFSIRPFAYSGFGVTMRRDFYKDAGQVITMCRFSPNCDKLLVSKAVLKAGFGYDMDNCTHGALFQVADTQKFYDAQIWVGNHVPFVYGDYYEEMKELGKILGLEVLAC